MTFNVIYDIASEIMFLFLFITWSRKDSFNFFMKFVCLVMALFKILIILWDTGFIIKP